MSFPVILPVESDFEEWHATRMQIRNYIQGRISANNGQELQSLDKGLSEFMAGAGMLAGVLNQWDLEWQVHQMNTPLNRGELIKHAKQQMIGFFKAESE